MYVLFSPCASIRSLNTSNALQTTKQLKCIPFPNYEPDNDVPMSDTSSESDLVINTTGLFHTRLVSNASTSSSVSSASSDSISGTFVFVAHDHIHS